MSRLIDADNLIKVLEESHKAHSNDSREESLFRRDLRIIMEQPTAYDVEAVDKQVWEITSRILNFCEEIDNNIPADERSGYDMLQDINLLREMVEKGGM